MNVWQSENFLMASLGKTLHEPVTVKQALKLFRIAETWQLSYQAAVPQLPSVCKG